MGRGGLWLSPFFLFLFFFFFLRAGHGHGGGFSRRRGRSPHASGGTRGGAARPIPELSALFLPLRAQHHRTPTPPWLPSPCSRIPNPSCHPAAPGSAPPAAFAPPPAPRPGPNCHLLRVPVPCHPAPRHLCRSASFPGTRHAALGYFGAAAPKMHRNTQSRVPRVLCPRSVPSAPTSACSQLCTARSSLPKPTPGRSPRAARKSRHQNCQHRKQAKKAKKKKKRKFTYAK